MERKLGVDGMGIAGLDVELEQHRTKQPPQKNAPDSLVLRRQEIRLLAMQAWNLSMSRSSYM
jgi:hypothetical protein